MNSPIPLSIDAFNAASNAYFSTVIEGHHPRNVRYFSGSVHPSSAGKLLEIYQVEMFGRLPERRSLPTTVEELTERLETVHRVLAQHIARRGIHTYENLEDPLNLAERAVRAAMEAAVERLDQAQHAIPEPVDLRETFPMTRLTGATAELEGRPPAGPTRGGRRAG